MTSKSYTILDKEDTTGNRIYKISALMEIMNKRQTKEELSKRHS